MEKAKAAVSEFLHKSGHNDTTVHEHVAPAVTNENVTRTHHNETTTAVDREIHQDHHHTTVQPVTNREVLPEKHSHHMAGVEHREHHHGNSEAVKARLEQEAAQFKNTRTEGETRETQSTAPVVGGEHIHHHVHETIQPVIQKELVQPSVVHTTVPIHEVHHNEAKHHSTTALPAVSMAEFKQGGGVINGREERRDRFDGEPKGISSHLGGSHSVTQSGAETTGSNRQQTTAGSYDNAGKNLDPRVDSDMDGSHNMSTANGSTNNTDQKVSLLDKLNPMKDTDHDGKKGVMT